MITHRTLVTVPGGSAHRIYRVLAEPTDPAYQQWWPGTHLAFHVVRRAATSPVGDVVVMDERVGRRRLRFSAVVRAAEPDRRLTVQLRKGIALPAWLDIRLTEVAEGVQVDHELRLGWSGTLGKLTDPVLRLWFSPAFADALTVHASTEFPLLAPGGGPAPAPLRPLPLRWSWARAAAPTLGPDAPAFLTDLELHHARVLTERPAFVADPTVVWHFERSIAPMVAAYRTFADRGDPDPLAATTRLVEARWQELARVTRVATHVRLPWRAASWLIRTVTERGFPAPGWQVTWVERSDRRVAFDITDCVFLRTFAHLGVPELTPLACRGDDVLYGGLPGVRFTRTGTLGRGDPRCDFAFERTPRVHRARGEGRGTHRPPATRLRKVAVATR